MTAHSDRAFILERTTPIELDLAQLTAHRSTLLRILSDHYPEHPREPAKLMGILTGKIQDYRPGKRVTIGAFRNGALAGFLCLATTEDRLLMHIRNNVDALPEQSIPYVYEHNRHLEITNAFVAPESIGTGIGDLLMRSVIERCNQKGVKLLSVVTGGKFLGSARFWGKHFECALPSFPQYFPETSNDALVWVKAL